MTVTVTVSVHVPDYDVWKAAFLPDQVAADFNYTNRTVLGLGCSTAGDILGLSPNKSDNPDDWSHT